VARENRSSASGIIPPRSPRRDVTWKLTLFPPKGLQTPDSRAIFPARIEEVASKNFPRRIPQIPGEDGRSKWWFRQGDVLMRFHAGFA